MKYFSAKINESTAGADASVEAPKLHDNEATVLSRLLLNTHNHVHMIICMQGMVEKSGK